MRRGLICLGLVVLALGVARGQRGCEELARVQVADAVLTDAVEVAGTPVKVGAVEVRSLPAHCVVHGEVNRQTGVDGKEYGDRFELRMPDAWKRRVLFVGAAGWMGW